jgi:hypothetical protein
MAWVCPLCGYENDDDVGTCICGYQYETEHLNGDTDELLNEEQKGRDSSHVLDRAVKSSQEKAKSIKVRVPEKPVPSRGKTDKEPVRPSDEVKVKELDGWTFTFSGSEGCLYLGTPALQSFRLKLTIDDVKEILDIMYEKSGLEKTTRKLQLSSEEVIELLSILDTMIDEKRSKVKITYSSEEIDAIADMINKKLIE